MVRKVLLIGATGLTGQEVLSQLLKSESIDCVIAPSRRALEITHSKLINPLFQSIDELDLAPFDVDLLISCFGTTKKRAGGSRAFRELEKGFMETLLAKVRQKSVEKVVLISSMGANETSLFDYLRVKAEIESFATELKFQSLYLLRPSFLLGRRGGEMRTAERVIQYFLSKFSFLKGAFLGVWGIEVIDLSRFILKICRNPVPGIHVIDNKMLHLLSR